MSDKRKSLRIFGWLLPIALVLLCGAAAAQETPKLELFGGYSYLHLQSNGNTGNFHGWNASLAGNLTRNFSLVADFGGGYDSGSAGSASLHTFLFGPQLTARRERADIFVHGLFGAARARVSASGLSASAVDFAMAVGGGVDVHAGRRVSFRIAQIDYLLTRFGGNNQDNLRISTGLVIRFGKR